MGAEPRSQDPITLRPVSCCLHQQSGNLLCAPGNQEKEIIISSDWEQVLSSRNLHTAGSGCASPRPLERRTEEENYTKLESSANVHLSPALATASSGSIAFLNRNCKEGP